MKKKRRITPVQRAVLTAAVAHRDATLKEIGMMAGIEPNTAASVAGRILRKQSIQERYQELMARTPGLEDQALLNKIAEGTGATRIERFAHEGRVRTEKVDVDFLTRCKYLDLAVRLNGALTQRVEVAGKNGAPLLPDPLMHTLEGMSKDALILLLGKLATSE